MVRSPSEDSDDAHQYNPDQTIDERREIQRGIREIENDMHMHHEDYLLPGSDRVLTSLEQLNTHAARIEQTAEAAIESKTFLHLADLSNRKLAKLTQGSLANGVDVDEFVSKCITYMREGRGVREGEDGGGISATQQHNRDIRSRRAGRGTIGGDSDDSGDDGDGDALDWAHFGRYACIPNIRRPATMGFLLGPLAMQKKVRKVTARTARLKESDLQQTRPTVISQEDLAQNERNDLTTILKSIRKDLVMKHQEGITLLSEVHEAEDTTQDDVTRTMAETGITETGYLDLMRFVVNPHSFGQTVENMFYVSFMIRENWVKLHYEDDGLPSLMPLDPDEINDNADGSVRNDRVKHQAIMSIDMQTWQAIIELYSLKEPLIKNRKEHVTYQSGGRGWYS